MKANITVYLNIILDLIIININARYSKRYDFYT